MTENMRLIAPLERSYLPPKFVVKDWTKLKPWYAELAQRPLNSKQDLEQWLKDWSELDSVVSEDACWRQIKMTCDTTDKNLEEHFAYFCTQIQPQIAAMGDKLNRRLVESPYLAELDADLYATMLRRVKKSIELFRKENLALLSDLAVQQQEFGAITGAMTVQVDGQEYTLQQAAKFLESKDRSKREEVYHAIQQRRAQDKDQLNELYTALIAKRDEVARNAGFANFRDYAFASLGRFDYGKEECFAFHQAVKDHVLPLVNEIYRRKAQKLGLEKLRPWDLEATPENEQPLKPFNTGEELLAKTIACFEQLDPFFADCLRQMKAMNRLDLESRKGKAPGGYNCPLAETGAPFIFMNAAGQMDDVTTMVHEGGHAVHSFLAHELPLAGFKEYPMEIAEVASMAMELMSMDKWEAFFGDDAQALKQAQEHQLERVITIFPWIATIDKFQHWVYEHPNHSLEERQENWLRILNEFTVEALDVSGLEQYRATGWQKQLHLFEVPFYYIEYGIAQLGAIGMWQQYKQDPKATVEKYKAALKLGATKTLPELYATAGLKFDFSPGHIKTLMDFVHGELKQITA